MLRHGQGTSVGTVHFISAYFPHNRRIEGKHNVAVRNKGTKVLSEGMENCLDVWIAQFKYGSHQGNKEPLEKGGREQPQRKHLSN